jgi:CheY-like chemotaxis protein
MVSRILTRLGCIVSVADNGSVALDLVRQYGPEYFHIILCDAIMPVMDGYTATRELRSSFNLRIPIVALTGNALQEDINKFIRAGADDVMTKPVSVKQLEECLKKWVPQNTYKGDISRITIDDAPDGLQVTPRSSRSPRNRNSLELNDLNAASIGTDPNKKTIGFPSNAENRQKSLASAYRNTPITTKIPPPPMQPTKFIPGSITSSRRNSATSIHSEESPKQLTFDAMDTNVVSRTSRTPSECLPNLLVPPLTPSSRV